MATSILPASRPADQSAGRAAALDDVGELRRSMAEARDLDTLQSIFASAMAGFGFSVFAAGYVPGCASAAASAGRPQPFLLNTWPRSWLEIYAREGFAQEDVVVAEAAAAPDPFTWSEVRARRPGASARIFATAAEFGWSDGLCVPVHDPRADPAERLGLVSLAAASLDRFDQARRDVVVLLSLSAFGAARRFAVDRSDPDRHALPPRERHALALVATGLSDGEVANAMGISKTTAHHHVETAKARLGAKTRAQAVAIALTRNMLPVLAAYA